MRPLPGEEPFLRRGRASPANESPTGLGVQAGPQMTYFFGDEAAVESAMQQQAPPPSALARPNKDSRKPSPPHSLTGHATGEPSSSSAKHGLSTSISPVDRGRNPSPRPCASNASQPMTPSLPPSALSSLTSSRRNSLSGSLSEDVGSQTQSMNGNDEAIEDRDGDDDQENTDMLGSGSSPQLIMPSIKMPSRRPFTAEGKAMGRLKVLVAGGCGLGKTSLIKAVVQSCEHIVHVDPMGPSPLSSVVIAQPRLGKPRRASSRRPSSAGVDGSATRQITEIWASTKPYPEWWSEIDDVRMLKRRKSLGDAVLDRNVCFVDTPGHGSAPEAEDNITSVVQYVEAHFERLNSNTIADADLLNLLGGDGGVQVDVLFYMVANRLRPVDLRCLQHLTPLTNVILLLSRADLMSSEQVAVSKEQIWGQLREAKIRPFSFGDVRNYSIARGGLYAVSSATGSDYDTMDASLLMSPDYVQPLISTELANLVQHVFSPNGVSWLRHAAARKYMQWRAGENSTRPSALNQYRPSLPTSSYAPCPNTGQEVMTSAHALALALVSDHSHREAANVRLANWALDLQQSLANERVKYEALARSERAFWLTEKLNECVQEGTLVPVAHAPSPSRGTRSARKAATVSPAKYHGVGHVASCKKTTRHRDPLGLLEVAAHLRRKGLLALELLGGLGFLGGLALWASQRCWHFQPYEWVLGEWHKFWNGTR